MQKEVVVRCRQLGRPVIVASHLLQSMIEYPTPTRAEVRPLCLGSCRCLLSLLKATAGCIVAPHLLQSTSTPRPCAQRCALSQKPLGSFRAAAGSPVILAWYLLQPVIACSTLLCAAEVMQALLFIDDDSTSHNLAPSFYVVMQWMNDYPRQCNAAVCVVALPLIVVELPAAEPVIGGTGSC